MVSIILISRALTVVDVRCEFEEFCVLPRSGGIIKVPGNHHRAIVALDHSGQKQAGGNTRKTKASAGNAPIRAVRPNERLELRLQFKCNE